MTEPTENEAPARPPVAGSPLSVILIPGATPAEGDAAFAAWRAYLTTLDRPFETLRLHDAPLPEFVSDDTQRVVAVGEAGLGSALNEAIRIAAHPLLAFCPCDQQYRPEDLGVLLAAIDQVDLVTAMRVRLPIPLWRRGLDFLFTLGAYVVLGGAPTPRRTWLGAAGWGRRWVARWIYGVRVTDPECPFRLFRRQVFERMPLQAKGDFVQIEMLAKANQLECLITEEPVAWTAPAIAPPERHPFRDDSRLIFREPQFAPRAVTPPPPVPEEAVTESSTVPTP